VGGNPQLVALLIVWLGIWICAAWLERQRLWWSFAATLIALVAGAEFLLPGWISQFRAALAEYYNYTGGGKTVLDLALSPLVGRTLALVLVVISLILVRRDRYGDEQSSQFRQSLALVFATMVTIIPMFAPYNQVLLVPAVMLLIANAQPLWSKNQMCAWIGRAKRQSKSVKTPPLWSAAPMPSWPNSVECVTIAA
jgi:hypothetical protein